MDELKYKPKNAWANYTKETVFDYCEGYKTFLNSGKTERELALLALKTAKSKGFVDLYKKESLEAGDKIYVLNKDKALLLAVIGKNLTETGLKLIAAHFDCPRLDLKPNPLYDDAGMALLKTHYYGGIKKYQWTAIPLAIHGVIILGNGDSISVAIGDEGDDLCFTITDLLIHLSSEQMKKTLAVGIEGENLNILCGSIPLTDGEKVDLKAGILKLLNEKYGICEEDFISAELEVVPSFNAKDVGFDKSMIGAYGQDDRVCAYTALSAIFDCENPEKTACCLLVDKEEIGSVGDTGMKSLFFENTIAEILARCDGSYNDLTLRRALSSSLCLSADVTAALDPSYSSVHDKQNAPILGNGATVMKYTGSRGKSGSNDTSAEFVGKIRRMLNENNISWQVGELGKVDAGGGGTIAQYSAQLNMPTLDLGVPLLSMHSPFEISSKVDIYCVYKTYSQFLK